MSFDESKFWILVGTLLANQIWTSRSLKGISIRESKHSLEARRGREKNLADLIDGAADEATRKRFTQQLREGL